MVGVLGGLTACSSDGGGGSVEAYCALTLQLNEQEDFPSDKQLDELVDSAPSEIRDPVKTAASALKDAGDNPAEAFNDPDVAEAVTKIEAFEQKNCEEADSSSSTDG